MHTIDELKTILANHGFKYSNRIVGTTSTTNRIFERKSITDEFISLQDSKYGNWDRGFEIDDWLSQNVSSPYIFAIVDDDSDMWIHKDKLVKTTWTHGMNKKP